MSGSLIPIPDKGDGLGTAGSASRRQGSYAHATRRAPAADSSEPKVLPLASYDVRVRRELAHRRYVVSVARQVLRIVSLHALDAVIIAGSVMVSAALIDSSATSTLPALVAFVLLGLNVRGSYRAGESRRDSRRLVTGVLIAVLLAAIPGTLLPSSVTSASFLTVFGLACSAALIIERQLVNAVVHQAYVRGFGLRRAVIISDRHEVERVMSGIARPTKARKGEPDDQWVVGYLTPRDTRDPDSLGSIARLGELLDTEDVSEVVVATSLPDQALASVAENCFARGVRVLVLPSATHSFRGWSELTRVGRWPAYQLHPPRLELPSLALKRASDLVLASIGLAVALPVIVLIGICIKIESRGPVFFRQLRVGLGGREFMMWKFRSMLMEAEARQTEVAHLNHYGDARLFKLRSDPRITRVGRVLRRFSLDELPQLFNVFSGDMSLVGPRPPLPSEVQSYESHHFVRLSVVPGITGPWQVNGRNLITDFEEVVRLEREYIESWSLRSDLEIMLQTLGVVISGRGAY